MDPGLEHCKFLSNNLRKISDKEELLKHNSRREIFLSYGTV